MAWEHAGYMAEATDAARLAKARLHHAELSAALSAEVASDANSKSTREIGQALRRLEEYIEKLEKREHRATRGVTHIAKERP